MGKNKEIVKWVYKLRSPHKEDLYYIGEDKGGADHFGPLGKAHIENIRYFAQNFCPSHCTLTAVTLKELFKARLAGR